jgi:hypothetical protein
MNLRTCAALLIATPALAAPAHDVCVPSATGVPTREGPPKWIGTWPGSGGLDQSLDDPRWLGAVGHVFQYGSARAPLQSRAVYSNNGGQEYLYLSFVVDLEALQVGSQATSRDIFVGFRRANPDTRGTSDPGDDEYGYIFQFHLMPGAAASPYTPITPVYCGDYDQAACTDGGAGEKDYWRVFVDRNEDGQCTATSPQGHQYREWNGASYTAPPADLAWMADAVRYWKYDAAAAEPLHNRWAVQIRFPIADATHGIKDGIERGSTFWYQATASVTGTGGGPYVNIGQWPTELTKSVCPKAGIPDKLIHEELGPADGTCLLCSVDKFSTLTDLTGARPSDCDAGIAIESAHVGSLFEVATGTDLTTVTPTNEFRALKADGTPGTNTVLAQPHNTHLTTESPAVPITAPLYARFRLASWGSAPWSVPGDIGKWKDIRGSNGGVCASGTYPNCSNVTIDPDHVGAISFTWKIGDDTGTNGIGDSEYCKYGLTPPAGHGTCGTCSCSAAGAQCDTGDVTGVSAGTWPCVSSIYQYDQCMLVELGTSSGGTGGSGGTTFVAQSTWNNMTFGEMSIDTRQALIDARHLPVAPGQLMQDIYLVVMPRNMPENIPVGSTAISMIQANALGVAQNIAQPYIDDLPKIGDAGAREIAARLRERARTPRALHVQLPPNAQIDQIRKAMEIMPDADFWRVGHLIEIAVDQGTGPKPDAALVRDAVTTLGPADAAAVVPTLEIYPFYQPMGRGATYEPMTSFSLFLSHEQNLAGIHYEIDGAVRVGQNVFHLQVPVGYAKRIQVRSQAIQPPELVEPPGNPRWPCGCCGAKSCGLVAGAGYFGPGLVAGVFVIRRRRRAS